MTRRLVLLILVAMVSSGTIDVTTGERPAVTVESVGMTVSNMDRAIAFYTSVLTFEQVSDVELEGRNFELFTGVFGARARIVRLRLGAEMLELREFLAPRGRPFPADMRANDLSFQHAAIIVSDMDAAYERLRQAGVAHASTGPQRLPDWNPNAGGIRAFYFRDPDGHFLEVLAFPPGKGAARWQTRERLFLGIDHTAIVVSDTERSLAFYHDVLGLSVAGSSENHDIEQEHLNNVFGARLRITTLRDATGGPGVELLEYLAPRDGRPAPHDLRANDIAHWQTTVAVPDAAAIVERAALRPPFALVSPRVVSVPLISGAVDGALVRDPDGHGVQVLTKRSGIPGIEAVMRN